MAQTSETGGGWPPASGLDHAEGLITSEDGTTAAERQEFFEVLVCCDRMRLPALLMRDHLERRGISDGGLAAAVCRRMRQLNAIRARNGTLADLPGERPFPPWAREATVRWREERDRRARR